MPAIYDSVDLRFSWNGDLLPGDNGDLQDTYSDMLQSLVDQLHNICASELGDWEIYPNWGAGLDAFIGEPNTRNTASLIRERLRLAIVSAELVLEEDLDIKVVPVNVYKLMIIIAVNAIATPFNRLANGNQVQVALVFDTVQHQVTFLAQPPQLILNR